MGVSVPVSAIIIFIGTAAFIASSINLATNIMQSLMELTSSLDGHRNRAYTRIEICNAKVSNGTIILFIKNFGPETIFLVDQGYRWCSLIISYNSTKGWITYLIEDYDVAGKIILSSNSAYGSSQCGSINPGEGAWITAKMPDGAPEVIGGSPITIIFSTGLGETSRLVVVSDD